MSYRLPRTDAKKPVFIIQIRKPLTETYTSLRYVAEHMWDGSWSSPDARDSKVWKTKGGAERWLRDRPEIKEKAVILETYCYAENKGKAKITNEIIDGIQIQRKRRA